MRKNTCLLVLLNLIVALSIAQPNRGRVISFHPAVPNIGDTLSIEIETGLSSYSASGSGCGVMYNYGDTIRNNELILNTFFDFCFTGTPPYWCYRTDTIEYVIMQSNLTKINVFWHIRSTLCTPLSTSIQDSVIINLNSTDILESLLEFNVNTYPNPVKDQLYLMNTTNLNIQKIQLYDARGGLVKEVEQESETINVAKLKSGLYILRIVHEGDTEIHKILKE